jgi:hypothetical protein
MIPAMARRIARRRVDLRLFAIFEGGTVSGTTARTESPGRGHALLPERLVSGYEAFPFAGGSGTNKAVFIIWQRLDKHLGSC